MSSSLVTAVKPLAVAGLFLWMMPAAGATEPALERVVKAVSASAFLPADIVEEAKAGCNTALCFGKTLAEVSPGRVRLEKVDHPDTDAIRWVTTAPSVIADQTGRTLRLKLTHFGRKAVDELREALAGAGWRLVVDLRGNEGGDFERMLSIAGVLLGPRAAALTLHFPDRIETRSLQGEAAQRWRVERVLIDEDTASAALALARLLAAHGKATLVGPDVGGPIDLKHRITIDHDWRLILPIAEITIP